MQVASRRETRGADIADDLAARHVLANPDRVAAGMVVPGRHVVAADLAMIEHEPVPVTPVEVLLGNDSVSRRPDRGAARGAEVGAVMELPHVQDGVEPLSVG